nr:hypothetical protein [candidate division Zixibacteria bacterium]
MFSTRLNGLTAIMIYTGIFLLSILSFFTTYYGMKILLNTPLALIGSFGLQIALLGIAWSLMKIKTNRAKYVTVFLAAATFSIFFSYANFDTALKSPTRSHDARAGYAEAARPVMAQYRMKAREAAQTGRYQVERIGQLLQLEQDKGWATVVDEGSNDAFVQAIIEGARRTVESWEKREGRDYRQGKGKGIILNYLLTQQDQARRNLAFIESYISRVDSLSLILNSALPVTDQNLLVNSAWVEFPTAAAGAVMAGKIEVPGPPFLARYVESPTSNQQAFLMVIGDLFALDHLAIFSMVLAFVIDFIIILMSFTGSHTISDEDLLFNKLKGDTLEQIKNIKSDDNGNLSHFLNSALEKLKTAGRHNLDIIRVISDYNQEKRRLKISLKRGEEKSPDYRSSRPETDNEIPDKKRRNNRPLTISSKGNLENLNMLEPGFNSRVSEASRRIQQLVKQTRETTRSLNFSSKKHG